MISLENKAHIICLNLWHIMRKPAFCKGKNKGADQLRGNCASDQHLSFCYTDMPNWMAAYAHFRQIPQGKQCRPRSDCSAPRGAV